MVVVGSARLWVSHRQFWLLGEDGDTLPNDGVLPPMSFVQIRPSGTMITTGLSMGDIVVTVAQLDSAPEELDPSEMWEDIVEFSLGADTTPPIMVVALEASSEPGLPDVSARDDADGPFRVRVHAIGRHDPDPDLDGDETAQPKERYLIQSWETEASDPKIIRERPGGHAARGIYVVGKPETLGQVELVNEDRWMRNAPLTTPPQTIPATGTADEAWPSDTA